MKTRFLIRAVFTLLALAPAAFAQTAATLAPSGNQQYFDVSSGASLPCVNCTLSTFAAGTSTPLKTYTDSTATTQNPFVITLNAQGYSASGIWVGGTACYKFVLANAASATVWSQDNICNQAAYLATLLAGPGGGATVGFEQVGGIPSTVNAALLANPFDFQYGSLQAAINSVPTGGYITVTGAQAGPVTIPTAIHVMCQPGATITGATSSGAVIMTGGATIEGCTVRNTGTGPGILIEGGTGTVIRNVTIPQAGANGIFGFGTIAAPNINVLIDHVTVSGTVSDPIYFQDNLSGLEIKSSTVDNTGAAPTSHGIGVHQVAGTTSVSNIDNVNIHDNTITVGAPTSGGSNFGVEVGYFSLARPITPLTRIKTNNNTVNFNSSGSGSISYSYVSDGEIAGNIVYENGNCIGFGSPETIGGFHDHVHHNTSTGASLTCTGGNFGFTVNGQSDSTYDHNYNDGAIYIGSSLTGFNAAGNKIDHNTVDFRGQTGTVFRAPIWIQGNFPSGSFSYNTIDSNTLFGNGTSPGIFIENDYGGSGTVLDGTIATYNRVSNVTGLFGMIGGSAITSCQFIGNQVVGASFGMVPETISTLCGSGVFQDYGYTPSTTGSASPTPICTLGAASGWTPGTLCSATGSGGVLGNASKGTAFFSTNSSGTGIGVLFILTYPTGFFAPAPIPFVTSQYISPGDVSPQYFASATTSVVTVSVNNSLTASTYYAFNYLLP